MRNRNAYPAILAGVWFVVVGAAAHAAEEAPTGDAAAGQAVYQARCSMCHDLEAHNVGPRLGDVVGRQAGSTDFEGYLGLRRADFVWDEALLDEYLADPLAFVKKHNRRRTVAMGVFVESPQERADVIEFLRVQEAGGVAATAQGGVPETAQGAGAVPAIAQEGEAAPVTDTLSAQ